MSKADGARVSKIGWLNVKEGMKLVVKVRPKVESEDDEEIATVVATSWHGSTKERRREIIVEDSQGQRRSLPGPTWIIGLVREKKS